MIDLNDLFTLLIYFIDIHDYFVILPRSGKFFLLLLVFDERNLDNLVNSFCLRQLFMSPTARNPTNKNKSHK